jgi:hypothetical protein
MLATRQARSLTYKIRLQRLINYIRPLIRNITRLAFKNINSVISSEKELVIVNLFQRVLR